ncbi:hypothetical protein PsorP6_010853 [Peronosclerospora sorghi]|uniref:Uncharacterized protein n=1 Tax=Peronosclerospora sorghi TaxID=230839 RepID=A0ACC0VZ52_9STRA|nr:hypothetical protein PsorP6_010853 [Peronosclerospora sorghi]
MMSDQSMQYMVGLYPSRHDRAVDSTARIHVLVHERPLVVKNALNDFRFSPMGFVRQTGLRFDAGGSDSSPG